MDWMVITLLVFVGLALVWLVWARRRADKRVDEADPLFVVGIALTGAGAATITTLGMFMIAVFAVGLVLMAIGIRRSRRPPRHTR